ncbi:RNA cap guanine-N2 methyltransferase-domain-containing protein [Lipomyces tetrasporus]|uniref:Trimethylguanosine synthase n=1 Tax=Lipomyces tetrasporus TaxID=54092 RepID=A0AAD7QXB6_9ASCO|nr:RNA cap guanine-N2 methyltransferase-domain-containing protein [Lipomyces tetrasporus]KAJ8103198.1 RNA cap guanine-N2 methyltransferase-domain-containing protein [Lipomyces tetrasporus]
MESSENSSDDDAELELYDDGADILDQVAFTAQTMPNGLKKYWKQRFSLFSKFSEGIWMNEQSWYSVTPELIAKNIAEHIYNNCRPSVVLDAFCGAGGNTIQLAMLVDKVIAVEKDPVTIRCAKHNAEIYGVADKIEFIEGDFFEHAPFMEADVVFLSPPWGGPQYLFQEVFDLHTMEPYNLATIMDASRPISPHIAVYLPRNSNIAQVRQQLEHGRDLDFDDNTILISYLHVHGKCKAICTYYGALAVPSSTQYSILPAAAADE